MNTEDYRQYIRYAVILVLAAATAGVVWFVQWLFAFDFSQDDVERIIYTLLGLLGIAIPGAAALKAAKTARKPDITDGDED